MNLNTEPPCLNYVLRFKMWLHSFIVWSGVRSVDETPLSYVSCSRSRGCRTITMNKNSPTNSDLTAQQCKYFSIIRIYSPSLSRIHIFITLLCVAPYVRAFSTPMWYVIIMNNHRWEPKKVLDNSNNRRSELGEYNAENKNQRALCICERATVHAVFPACRV